MNTPRTDAVSLTRKLIQIESTNPGTFESGMTAYLKNYFQELPSDLVSIQTKEVLPGRYNLMATIADGQPGPALVFVCHMDTVPVGDNWSVPPLEGLLKDEFIFGRGACDMKSGLACALSAFSNAAASCQKGKLPQHTLKFIATVDEEDFMQGVTHAISLGWVSKEDYILDTEPTSHQIQMAHKGRLWLELCMNGITSHASMPWEGADAIAAISEAISYIRKEVHLLPSDKHLGESTVTFGQIKGGSHPYLVPDFCSVSIDLRLVPPTDSASALQIVNKALSHAAQEVPGIQGSYCVTGDRPFIEFNPNSPFLEELKQAYEKQAKKPARISAFPGYTDTAVIAGTLYNQNCLSFGPGNLELAHKPNECVPISDIKLCEKVLIQLINQYLFK